MTEENNKNNDKPESTVLRRGLAIVAGKLIIGAAGLLTGVRAIWSGTTPKAEQTHVLRQPHQPRRLRAAVGHAAGPICARSRGRWPGRTTGWPRRLRRFIGADVFNALMIRRDGSGQRRANPVDQMTEALHAGDSLIMFPEGTRNTGDEILLPLKSGLFHLARACPSVRAGAGVDREPQARAAQGHAGADAAGLHACATARRSPLAEDEDKDTFLARARAAVLDLRPEYDRIERHERLSPRAP